jgi:hypothetical protein
MASHPNFRKLTKATLRENIKAIEYCIQFDKSIKENWEEEDLGCLGMPAIILLCSVIDTMGSYFRGTSATIQVDGVPTSIETVSNHFLILNHDKLFNLNLSGKTIYDFYSKYRSPLTHNNTLPPNTSLEIGAETDDIFIINSDGEVTQVNLIPLFEKVKVEVETFIHFIDYATWSEDHKLKQELEARGNTSGIVSNSVSLTGTSVTQSTEIKKST